MAEKLKIESYKDDKFSRKLSEYKFVYNPENIAVTGSVEYSRQQAIGTTSSTNKYSKTNPEKLTLELIFDNTVIWTEDPMLPKPLPVTDEIEKFKDLVYSYNGDLHRPNFLKIIWGKFLFKAQITDFTLNYTSFSSAGEPLRAHVNAGFEAVKNIQARISEEDRHSSDLTHVYTVQEGDSLPILVEKVYGNSALYIKIAKINNLNNFRRLEPGTKLVLPPLEKI